MSNHSLNVHCLMKVPLLTMLTAMLFVGSSCSTNTDKSVTTDSGQTTDPSTATDGSGSTRPVGQTPDSWTDTPANQTAPDLSTEPTVGDQYCAQDKDYVYGDEAGCLFSIESFDKGNIQTLKCQNHQAYLNGNAISELKIGNLQINCL